MIAKGQRTDTNNWGHVFMLSSWGFAIVVASMLFLYLGYKMDSWLGTAPNFMLGLFLLAVITTIMALFHEAQGKNKQ
ncbi:MAG: AtpZ/AtpI family protein [Deltaproteobacteria bacterium]|nr:AtpZ/AtpI family protein [Deltaproteobacteria bacterium]